jgi:methionyl aminopeptidase
MISIKSAREIEIMRRSGKITSKTLTRLIEAAKPGVTTAQLNRIADESIRSMGGVPTFIGYHGYPSAICASVNDEVVHGMPGDRVLLEGDLLSLDIGTTFEGYVSDSAITVGIGEVSDEAKRLMKVTQECLMHGIAQMQAGNRLGDIGNAIQRYAESHGYGVVGTGTILRKGLVLAIEPMITEGTWEVETLDDGWTVVTEDGKLAAHFEHTIAITDQGPKILTLREAYEHPDVALYRPEQEVAA